MLSERVSPLANAFRCPVCSQTPLEMSLEKESLSCKGCGSNFPIKNGIPILLSGRDLAALEAELVTDTGLAMVSEYAAVGSKGKGNISPSFLSKLVDLLKPPQVLYDYNPDLQQPHTQPIFDHAGQGTLILNVGGGPTRYSEQEITMNLRPFFNVDSVGDAHNIPYQDNTFDSVICNAVLEHVHEPDQVVAEMLRVLKPGGVFYAEVPFMWFFHGYPNDFRRYTLEGMKRLFTNVGSPSFGLTQGPVSALLQAGNTTLEILLPTENRWVRKSFNGLYRWLFFWFKYIDKLLLNKPNAHLLAGGFYVLGTKSEKLEALRSAA